MGIPCVYELTKYGTHDAMIMETLGPSLHDLFIKFERKFTEKTILMIAIQLLHRIEYVHNQHIIHRDIKPDNFLIGLESLRQDKIFYIIDFGLAKYYITYSTLAHIPFVEKVKVVGTCYFASINTHKGVETSRRDDLESLGYVFMYFLSGHLPWQKLKADTTTDLWKKCGAAKMNTPLNELCKNCPEEFSTYLAYVRALGFSDNPDYNYLRSLFKNLFDSKKYVDDGVFDWCTNL